MAIEVRKPGLATTVQDLGRPGHYDVGIPISGAMDRFALRCANMLVGNDEGAAALECVFMGPELLFTADALVAVTGAELPPKVDGIAQATWTSFAIKAGQALSFDYLRGGARAYVAVAGGIDVPAVMGSRSTYALGALGGHEGRPLKAGDTLALGAAHATVSDGRAIPAEFRRDAVATTLRVLPGLYDHRITRDAAEAFFSDSWKVAPEADRIGYRFKGGRPLSFVERTQPFGAGSDPSNIVDSCYPYGSIQVPGGTEPIVLHRDAVSGGGYFMLGTVISADMDAIGQLPPHVAIRFARVTMAEALDARRARREALDAVRSNLRR